ncbi:organic cation transporter protein-like [Anneissia japonica]|uniref:organic cation transporter protein-like n=1 Tax=Anneissia japonica TaxID=1529436 RepID=UPI0014255F84|nr:organic cation transporter protein-like [Anneissia japonica]
MKFDEILQYLGEFGFYQKKIYFILCFMGTTTMFHMVAQVFLAPSIDHWCKAPQLDQQNCSLWQGIDEETCNALKYNATIPEDDSGTILRENQCRRCNVTYSEFDVHTERCQLSDQNLQECGDGWEYDHSQYKATVVEDFDLVCDDGSKASLAQSIYFGGVLIGSLLFGAMADYIGRKSTMFICIFITLVFSIAVMFSPGYWWFTMLRAVVGCANIGIYLMAFTLSTEIVGPSKRTFVGIVLNFYIAVGIMICGLLAYFIRDWRWLQLAISVPNIFYFFIYPIIPESPRWLISQKRFDEAEAIIMECARVNKVDNLPPDILDEEKAKVEPDVIYSIADLFRTPNMRKKTINILYNWMVNSLVYYGLSLGTSSLGGRDYLAFILSGAVEVPSFIIALPAMNKYGRRPVLCVFMVLGGVACFTSIWVPIGWARTTVSLIGKFGIAASFAIIYVFSAELYPTPIRSAGMGTASMTARIGGILAPIILEIGKLWRPLPLIIFSLMSISAGLLALLLPETLNKNLPETIEEGEAFGKKIPTVQQEIKPTMVDYSGQVDMESTFTNKACDIKE